MTAKINASYVSIFNSVYNKCEKGNSSLLNGLKVVALGMCTLGLYLCMILVNAMNKCCVTSQGKQLSQKKIALRNNQKETIMQRWREYLGVSNSDGVIEDDKIRQVPDEMGK